MYEKANTLDYIAFKLLKEKVNIEWLFLYFQYNKDYVFGSMLTLENLYNLILFCLP